MGLEVLGMEQEGLGHVDNFVRPIAALIRMDVTLASAGEARCPTLNALRPSNKAEQGTDLGDAPTSNLPDHDNQDPPPAVLETEGIK